MRFLPAILVIALIWILSRPLGSLPAIGTMIDPVNGMMAAAEPVDKNFNANLKLTGIQAPVEVWFEDRLVPHIRAQNDHDLYFAQGFVHAYFRLWQMDMQTRAAGGRVSEVAGEKALEFDRGQRRKGMVYGAEKSLAAMEADPRTRGMLNAYRDGINSYIATLSFRELPIEYKLMGFRPEQWTNLRSALLLKYMADDLTGKTDDIAFTLLRDRLGEEQFNYLFPERTPGSRPVIPEGTKFEPPSLKMPPVPGGEVWAHFPEGAKPIGNKQPAIGSGVFPGPTSDKLFSNNSPATLQPSSNGSEDPDVAIGSNNWAISGAHTASGKPILCNDPHLGLNLPSLWFEIQLTAPGINSYGVSLPGAPGIVIGYNDKISWGFTNNYRDVKDFYEIHPDTNRQSYTFNGRVLPFDHRVETIGIKGKSDYVDTVCYTIHGPVMYDPSFPDPAKTGALLACTWMAHRGTNELLALYLVNRAGDYEAFTQAIQHFECPAQNFVYSDVKGNIAMWGQGRFINKWDGQGRFVMNGSDSSTLWGESIPMAENPHVLNPPQGYVASANQQVTDSTYPYWYNGNFTEWRSWEINNALGEKILNRFLPNQSSASGITVDDQMRLQNDNSSLLYQKLAENVAPILAADSSLAPALNADQANHTSGWIMNPENEVSTFYYLLWKEISASLWRAKFSGPGLRSPGSEQALLCLQKLAADTMSGDSEYKQVMTAALKHTLDSVDAYRKTGLEWYRVKNTSLTHLARLPAFSYDHLKIGGWGNTINAASGNHGPSWRMIVEMDSVPKAYAIYPGGQSGNPGSRHYGDNVQQWVDGKYNGLKFLTGSVKKNPFKYTWTIRG
jgi:penicillin amidase